MKRNIPLLLFLCIFLGLNAQSQTVNITGTIFDNDTKEGVELASIRILNARDSAYVTGGVTDETGKFSIAVKAGRYITHVSFLGYVDQYINVATRQKSDIGDIFLKEDGVMLNEAIVEAKAPEIIVKGDTVEYNADAYKTQENAILADLIKKIPGAEIDGDGKITINGKEISKILVDGKEFFSDDPKVASENLPAKMIQKLQVLDKKSDLAQLTGFDDGEEQTVINLQVRPGMKEGVMAQLSGGYGNKGRYETNGLLNVARNDNRLSVVGNVNNNNNSGGGTGGGGRWGGDRGVSETYFGGANIAIEPSDKLKYDGDVQYNERDNEVESTSRTEYLDRDMVETNATQQVSNNKRFNTRLRMEWKPDSVTNIIFRPNLSYNKTNGIISRNNERTSEESLNNFRSTTNSLSNGNTLGFDGNLLFNRRLNDNGRFLTVEISGGLSDGDSEGTTYSEDNYYNRDSLGIQDQIYTQKDRSHNWRLRASYIEPIGKNNFLELAYNIRSSYSQTDKVTYNYDDNTSGYTDLAGDYTRKTENTFLNQNISLNFQSRRDKYNYTVGLGIEPSRSQTSLIQRTLGEDKHITKNFLNLAPRVEFNYLWDRQHNLRIRYDSRTNQASTLQLLDGVISKSGADVTLGNPNLKPSFEHRLNVRYRKYTPEKASTIMTFMDVSYKMDDIVGVSHTGEGNSRITTYENIDGNITGRFTFMYNTPLRNDKFSINTRTSVNYTRDNTFLYPKESIDKVKNTANVYNISENARLKYNIDNLEINVGGNIAYENNINSFSKDRNQTTYSYGGFGNFQWFLPYSFVLGSDLSYSSNSGYGSGYQQNSWLWNAELAKDFNITLRSGENATKLPATLKFRIYDILQDRSNISRTSNAQLTSFNTYNTISSYFMVGLTIKFQSFKGGAKMTDMNSGRRGGPEGGGGGRGGRF